LPQFRREINAPVPPSAGSRALANGSSVGCALRADGLVPLAQEHRRLAAILAADVVGYSRRMAADEGGTLARLTALRGGTLHRADHGAFFLRIDGAKG